MAFQRPLGVRTKTVVRKLRRERTDTIVSIFKSGEYSDLVIVNNDAQYKVHRAIVLPQSSVLKRLLESSPEAGIINLAGEDAATVRQMVTYLYHLDYYDVSGDTAGDHECLQHAKLYTIADRHRIYGLKKLALARFQDTAGTCAWDKTSMLAVAREAYERTATSDRGLQEAVVQVFSQHKTDLCKDGWKTDLQHMGALLYDLLVWENRREPREAGLLTPPAEVPVTEVSVTEVPEEIVPAEEAELKTPADDVSAVEEIAESAKTPEPEPESVPQPENVEVEEYYGGYWGLGRKKKIPEPEPEPEPEPVPEPEKAVEPEEHYDPWGFSSPKDRKKKKKKIHKPEPEPKPEPAPEEPETVEAAAAEEVWNP